MNCGGIQSGCKTRSIEDISSRGRELIFGKMTLEEFLVEARMYITNASIEPVMSLDSALTTHKFSSRMGFPPSPSIGELSDTPVGGNKRVSGDLDQAIERKLRRKNKESRVGCTFTGEKAGTIWIYIVVIFLETH